MVSVSACYAIYTGLILDRVSFSFFFLVSVLMLYPFHFQCTCEAAKPIGLFLKHRGVLGCNIHTYTQQWCLYVRVCQWTRPDIVIMSCWKKAFLFRFVWLVIYRPRQQLSCIAHGSHDWRLTFYVLPHTRQSGETMTYVSAGHILFSLSKTKFTILEENH